MPPVVVGDVYADHLQAVEAFRRQPPLAAERRRWLEARVAEFVAAERAQQRAEALRREQAHAHQIEVDARLSRCPVCRDWMFHLTSAGHRPAVNGRKARRHVCTVPLTREDLDNRAAA